jgi:hypothetical protein
MKEPDTTTMLQALAVFGPELRDPDASAGDWADQKGSGTADDPLTTPHFEQSDLLNRFEAIAYEAGWIRDFD